MTALESSGETTLNLRSQNYVKLDGKYIHFTFVKKQSSTIHPVSNKLWHVFHIFSVSGVVSQW